MRLEKSNHHGYCFTDYHSRLQGYTNNIWGKRYCIDYRRQGLYAECNGTNNNKTFYI